MSGFDTRMYPQGNGGIKARYVGTALVFYSTDTRGNLTELYRIDTTVAGGLIVAGDLRDVRQRFTIAQVNAGATLLAAAPAGFGYRMVAAFAIAIGGAAGAVTTVDLIGTQTTAVKLVAFGQAALTQNTKVVDGTSGGVILAGGASYVRNDVATAITVGKTSSDITTATHIDFNVTYVLEA